MVESCNNPGTPAFSEVDERSLANIIAEAMCDGYDLRDVEPHPFEANSFEAESLFDMCEQLWHSNENVSAIIPVKFGFFKFIVPQLLTLA